MEDQQGIAYQGDLFIEQELEFMRQISSSEGVTEAAETLEGQVIGAGKQGRALAGGLIGAVCSKSNLDKAYKQVKKNKGAAGIDGVPVGNFSAWFSEHGSTLISQLLSGEYHPDPVRTVSIPKANGGMRQLGIPTVKDRLIQQAITQVLTPLYEAVFSDHSYGFRPGRNTHQALEKASKYVSEGGNVVVDMDMKSFFDEVNHDRLMYHLSQKIKDKVLLLLIRRYLQSGILTGGLVTQRLKGTPQGSPLSPLLSNIVLDELDKELESRGHRFVRYCDDFSIFVCSQMAGKRVRESISNYLTTRLKLKVNEEKSQVCSSKDTKFLGYTIQNDGALTIASSSVVRLKQKVRKITSRNRGVSLETVVSQLTPVLRGWLNYFKQALCKRLLRDLDAWIRRRLRCFRLKQNKKTISVQRFLKRHGVPNWQSWLLALSGKGWWRKSSSPQAHQAMSLDWFDNKLGLYNLSVNYSRLKN